MKKIFSVLGNCQAPYVARALLSNPAFAAQFEYRNVPAVHVMPKPDIETHLARLESVDLVIHQPILDAGRFGGLETTALRARLMGKAALLCVPSCYFNGYFPTLGSISQQVSPAGGVHDLAVFHAFDLGWDVAKTEAVLYRQDLLGAAFYQRAFDRAMQQLEEREIEAEVNVRVSDLLQDLGRKRVLMHQFNHPTSGLFNALAQRICLYLGIEAGECDLQQELDTVVWPVWPWVRAALGLESGQATDLLVRREKIAMSDYISGAFATYATMPAPQRLACRNRVPQVRLKLEAL